MNVNFTYLVSLARLFVVIFFSSLVHIQTAVCSHDLANIQTRDVRNLKPNHDFQNTKMCHSSSTAFGRYSLAVEKQKTHAYNDSFTCSRALCSQWVLNQIYKSGNRFDQSPILRTLDRLSCACIGLTAKKLWNYRLPLSRLFTTFLFFPTLLPLFFCLHSFLFIFLCLSFCHLYCDRNSIPVLRAPV